MVVCKLLWSVLFSLFTIGYVCVSWRRLSQLREFTFPLHVQPDTSSLEVPYPFTPKNAVLCTKVCAQCFWLSLALIFSVTLRASLLFYFFAAHTMKLSNPLSIAHQEDLCF